MKVLILLVLVSYIISSANGFEDERIKNLIEEIKDLIEPSNGTSLVSLAKIIQDRFRVTNDFVQQALIESGHDWFPSIIEDLRLWKKGAKDVRETIMKNFNEGNFDE